MAKNLGSWCLIESDAGLFTGLISDFGCKGVQVEELWSFKTNLKPVHGLIFFFKRIAEVENKATENIVTDDRLKKIFFAKQIIKNACATQAILNILLNCKDPDIQLGEILTDFKEFCNKFDPYYKGLSLSNATKIRAVHNSFAIQTLIHLKTTKLHKPDGDIYHFIGYMPINGRLYELDGLKAGPIDHGPIAEGQNWMEVVSPIINKRITKYKENKIYFNIMAITTSRHLFYLKQMIDIVENESKMDPVFVKDELNRLICLREQEEEKRIQYSIENARRKHNYLPFIIELLKAFGEKKLLTPIYDKAKQHALERANKKS